MWSCGVVLYALLASSLPFDASDMQALVRMVCKGRPARPLPASRGQAAAALVKCLLSVDPTARPSAREVLENEWMSPAKQSIASIKTTPVLPQLDDGDAAEPGRKTVSGTAEFFRQMLASEKASAPSEESASSSERRQPGSLLTKEELAAIRAEAAAEADAEAEAEAASK